MTTRIALWLGGLIITGVLIDAFANDSSVAFFLAKKFMDLVQYVAFWR